MSLSASPGDCQKQKLQQHEKKKKKDGKTSVFTAKPGCISYV